MFQELTIIPILSSFTTFTVMGACLTVMGACLRSIVRTDTERHWEGEAHQGSRAGAAGAPGTYPTQWHPATNTKTETPSPALSPHADDASSDNEMDHSDYSLLRVGFIPTSEQRGLPPEIRDLIYTEIATHERLDQSYSRSLEACHWMYYRNNLDALNLLRNGDIWDTDAISAHAVQHATKTFTILAHWHTFLLPFFQHTKFRWLLDVLKGIDLVYALDMEYLSTSTTARKWAAPLSEWIMQHGIDHLWVIACSEPGRLPGKPLRLFHERADRAFLRTAILQLRRVPEITVRILVYEQDGTFMRLENEAGDVEKSLKVLLKAIADGETMTRLPRRTKDVIRYKVVLVSKRDQIELWKEKLDSVRNQVGWDIADEDEEQLCRMGRSGTRDGKSWA